MSCDFTEKILKHNVNMPENLVQAKKKTREIKLINFTKFFVEYFPLKYRNRYYFKKVRNIQEKNSVTLIHSI